MTHLLPAKGIRFAAACNEKKPLRLAAVPGAPRVAPRRLRNPLRPLRRYLRAPPPPRPQPAPPGTSAAAAAAAAVAAASAAAARQPAGAGRADTHTRTHRHTQARLGPTWGRGAAGSRSAHLAGRPARGRGGERSGAAAPPPPPPPPRGALRCGTAGAQRQRGQPRRGAHAWQRRAGLRRVSRRWGGGDAGGEAGQAVVELCVCVEGPLTAPLRGHPKASKGRGTRS